MIHPIAPFGPALVPVLPRVDRTVRTVSPAVCSHVRRAIVCACLCVSKRPKGSGKWFVCHQDKLSSIKYEEVCDIYEEFLKHHPNGGAATAGFVAVRLSDGLWQQGHLKRGVL